MLDATLAIAHHLLLLALFGVLVAEWVMVRADAPAATLQRIGRIDLWYGILAGVTVAVGLARAIYAAKGWAYYSTNAFFWAKMATFAAIAAASIPPTVAYLRWRKAPPDAGAIKRARRWLLVQLHLFALLAIFAALMARGYGQL